MNEIFIEDYRDTLKRGLSYDYVFTSPPDLYELGLDAKKKSSTRAYQKFLFEMLSGLCPSSGIITIAFTDRKCNGGILSKHIILAQLMEELGAKLLHHKIWVKSEKINLFRLTYGNVMSFYRGVGKVKQYGHKEFKPDVWFDGFKAYKGYGLGMPVRIPLRCIPQFTEEGDIVYDPFMGSGTTAIATLASGRKYIGSEIDKDVAALAEARIKDSIIERKGFF